MKYAYLFLVTLFFISCKNENSISIPNDITLKIKKGEKVFSNNDKILKNQYFSYFQKESNIPLYKNLVSKRYTIFTGIPFGTSFSELSNKTLLKPEYQIIKTQKNDRNFYKVSKDQNDNFIVEYIIKNKGLLYILASTKDSLLINSNLSQKNLDKRLILTK